MGEGGWACGMFLFCYSFEEEGRSTCFPDSLSLSETEAAARGAKATGLGLGSADRGGAC